MSFQSLREPRRRLLEIPPPRLRLPQIEGDLLGIEPGREVTEAGHRQMAAQDHAIEARENPADRRSVLGEESAHGAAPAYSPTRGGRPSARTTPLYSIL